MLGVVDGTGARGSLAPGMGSMTPGEGGVMAPVQR
jgi:hypothetical protein